MPPNVMKMSYYQCVKYHKMKVTKNFNVHVLFSHIHMPSFYKQNKNTDLPVMRIKIISAVRSLAFWRIL